jgi:Tol biopolymer transport system component
MDAAMASVCTAAPAGPAGASEPRPGTEFVDVTAGGVKGNGASAYPVVSADGRHVAFLSWATNLAPGDTDIAADVYVKDLRTGDLRWVSDVPGDQEFGAPSVSADGSRVAFAALAPNTWPPREMRLPAYLQRHPDGPHRTGRRGHRPRLRPGVDAGRQRQRAVRGVHGPADGQVRRPVTALRA